MSSVTTPPPPTSPPTSPSPPSSPPSSDPPPSSPDPPSSPPPSSEPPPSTPPPTPPPSSRPPSVTPPSSAPPSESVISTPVTTVIVTSIVQTSDDGQVYTTVLSSSRVLPPGSTISSSPSTSSTNRTNTGAIVGGVVGGIAGIAILALLFVFLRRRKRESDFDGNFDPDSVVSGASRRHTMGGGTLPNIRVEDDSPLEVGSNRYVEDDGMGGRLAGSAIGAGVITPYPLAGSRRSNTTSSAYPSVASNYQPGEMSQQHQFASVPVGGYFTPEKQQQHMPVPQRHSAAMPNPYSPELGGAYPVQPYPPRSPGSATSATHSADGHTQGTPSISSAYPPSTSAATSAYGAARSAKEREAMTIANPDDNNPASSSTPVPRQDLGSVAEEERSSNVMVHQDGGRLKVTNSDVDEIPPRYDDIQRD